MQGVFSLENEQISGSRFSAGRSMSLRQRFPMRFAYVARRNLWWILFVLLAPLFLLKLHELLLGLESEFWGGFIELLALKKLLFFSLASLAVCVKIFYDWLYMLRFSYFLENGRLHVQQGVFLQQEASIPMTPLCEFYVERKFTDLFFGTSDLIIKSVIGESQEVVRLQALSSDDSSRLKRYLIAVGELNSDGQVGFDNQRLAA